jgi:hypothetical protein
MDCRHRREPLVYAPFQRALAGDLGPLRDMLEGVHLPQAFPSVERIGEQLRALRKSHDPSPLYLFARFVDALRQ